MLVDITVKGSSIVTFSAVSIARADPMKKAGKGKLNHNKLQTTPGKLRPVVVLGVVATMIIGIGIAAYATNTLLQGHVRVNRSVDQAPRNPATQADAGANKDAVAQSKPSPKATLALVDKYGTAALSRAVAAAITKAESSSSTKAASAKAASDRYHALENGCMVPGTDPMEVIAHGYVPPGMDPQNAAIIYNGLPNNLKMVPQMPQPGSPEWVARMAGEPADPLAGLPQGLGRADDQTANQKMFDGYMRERFGPVYVPPLHRDHNAALQASGKLAVRDNQMSLIEAQYGSDGSAIGNQSIREVTDASGNVVSQYGYDPYGRQTKINGGGPDSDFGYAGMYVHQRSGLNLTPNRAYNPMLGRWMSRDPINDLTFRMRPQSPEPATPDPMLASATMASLVATVVPEATQLATMPSEARRLVAPSVLGGRVPILRSLMGGRTMMSHSLLANVPNNNLYVYVTNNPINFRDPSGLGDWAWCKEYCDLYANSSALAWLICMMWCMDNTHQPCPTSPPGH